MESTQFPIGAWLDCHASPSSKPEEAIVGIDVLDEPVPVEFFVDRSLVEPSTFSAPTIEGRVQVTVLGRHNGTAVVTIPGEPITFGPRLTVSSALLH